eukprot:8772179-Alexandrium_andersonii.AAC.1
MCIRDSTRSLSRFLRLPACLPTHPLACLLACSHACRRASVRAVVRPCMLACTCICMRVHTVSHMRGCVDAWDAWAGRCVGAWLRGAW